MINRMGEIDRRNIKDMRGANFDGINMINKMGGDERMETYRFMFLLSIFCGF
jgi:hypothetical protein